MNNFKNIKSAFDIQYPFVSSSLQDEIFKKTKLSIPVRYDVA